ncbi:hypothetical protein SUGI_0876510 [Cryptomeria japonica]|nr:hypothetical protein SUGI_0876510 [Cryptomeria japonica]
MDHIDTTQLKKLSRGEYSQARRSIGETTNLRTTEFSQPNKPIRNDHEQKLLVAKEVFLSHSGKQKNFVRQLNRDLANHGVSCFFDQDRESLPLGEDFPSRIFEAAKTCKVAVFLLSKDFLESKWPMLELSACVEARDRTRTNPNLKILPLFFQISPDALKDTKVDNEKWKQLKISGEKQAEWLRDLELIRRINGINFRENDDEVKFRDDIVKEIWHILPTSSPRYLVRCMQGQERMCQEVADFFKSVQSVKKGTSIAGLYGIPGQGKTTVAKAFCNFKMGDFEGKVCHLEFSRGDSFERTKLALQYLTRCPQLILQTLTDRDQAQVELYRRVKGQRILLVLDNVTEESIDEVTDYLKAELGENSCILLSARSVDVLEKHFKIGKRSCMRVPRLEDNEAIEILLEKAPIDVSTMGAEEKVFAVKCADRFLFEEVGRRGKTFHPLALKAFGGHLFSKYGPHLSKWAGEIEGWVNRCSYGLDDLLAVLGKAFDSMRSEYRTIFMLLTLYMPPRMSPHKVTEWLAMVLNKEISFIEKAVEDLCKMALIEEFASKIRIHDLYIEFAQSKANEMGRWLWWKGDLCSTRWLISQHNAGFELAKLEQCKHRRPSQITPHDLQNLLVLQLVAGVASDKRGRQVVNRLGDLSGCVFLREIKVRCPSLLDFPRLNGLPHLEKVEFSVCDKVKGPLDCRECVELLSIVIDSCSQMASLPLLVGCKKLSKIVLWECDAVKACPDIDVPGALKTLELFVSSKAATAPQSLESCYTLQILKLCNMVELRELPSFRLLSNLTVLKLDKCGIREPPDLTCCVLLEVVYFFTLMHLKRFPNFSLLRSLKKLTLYDCWRVEDPPDISGCHELQVFHLVYNDNMKGLPNMGDFQRLEEIKLSWHSYKEIDVDSSEFHVDLQPYEDLQSRLEHFKDENFSNLSDVSIPGALKEWQWLKNQTILGKRYVRGAKTYYSITAPYELRKRSQFSEKVLVETIGRANFERAAFKYSNLFYRTELMYTVKRSIVGQCSRDLIIFVVVVCTLLAGGEWLRDRIVDISRREWLSYSIEWLRDHIVNIRRGECWRDCIEWLSDRLVDVSKDVSYWQKFPVSW